MDNLPEPHPLAVEHLPGFITAPGQSDGLLNFVIIFLVIAVILTGVFYLKLHSLPERMMHGAHPAQFQIVAVLGLISLLTHNQIFWIAALLLAMIDIPSFLAPLTSMSRSLHRMSIAPARRGRRAAPPEAEITEDAPAPVTTPVTTADPVEGGRG
ncbi:hypothetical protein [Paracoccus zhejiangensis]|uniref:Uncharacterized protein n=1 Tax=Paracoccus zhejiangensis TaxID=1077935 RepID=A0A2H5EUB2_9RHOB|nr:hypothetical protein [Paracoccus zhejiangensis]AUH62883.1 hypothetical protein CX676_00800 [Paracoccus zhejiangensis]